MSESNPSLHDLVRVPIDLPQRQQLQWEGTFADYLELLEGEPLACRNAWQRMLGMIESHGHDAPARPGGPRRWRLFDDPFSGGRDAVYGLDESLDLLVQTVLAGACGYGPERRILLLHGPVGSSKSTIARLLKRGLERYSRSREGALYTFTWVIDGERIPSPTHQEPLLLLPAETRAAVEERLNRRLRTPYRLRIEGELDPVSRHWARVLADRCGGDLARVLEHVRVQRLLLSEEDRMGIGTFQPKDEKNQDSTELTGDVNYRRIAEYGSDSDPRCFNFDGEFNVANRGMLEFIEVLKLDVAFLYDLLGATQEHAIKPKKFALTHVDEVILGHTNEPEYKKLQNNELMEAFRDRTIKIDVPYNVSWIDEVKIYRRLFKLQADGADRTAGDGRLERRIAPHALEIAALWAVLTRLEEPTQPNLTLLQKVKLYAGADVPGFGPEHVREMRAHAEREGMSGISPRYVQDRVAAALVSDRPYLGALDVLRSLEAGLKHHSLISNEETRKRYVQLLQIAREEYEEQVKQEVQVAVSSDREACDRLCGKYLDNVKAYTTGEPVLDAAGRSREPDERLMRAIEQKMDIPEARKDDFRHELMNYVTALDLEGRAFDYRLNARLRRALELKLFEDRRDTIQLTSLVSSVVDPSARENIRATRDRMMERFGYDEHSADDVLQHVADLFARGEAKSAPAAAA